MGPAQRLALLLLLADGGCVGWLVNQGIHFNSADGPALVGLVTGQIMLELLAIPQRGFGFFSASFSCTLAITLLFGTAPAALGLTAGLVLRTALRKNGLPWSQAASEGFPALTALCLLQSQTVPTDRANWMQAIAIALAVYIPFSIWVPERLARAYKWAHFEKWIAVRQLTASAHFLAVGFAGAVLAYLMSSNPAQGLWLVPVLLSLHRASRTELLRLDGLNLEELRLAVHSSRRLLNQAALSLDSTQRELKSQAAQRALLENLSVGLLNAPDRASVLRTLIGAAASVTRAESVVFFSVIQDAGIIALRPELYQSPYGARVEGAALTGVTEPIAMHAWRTGQLQIHQGNVERIFREEDTAVAVPIAGQGVLYVGRRGMQAFGHEELSAVSQIGGQGALALQSTKRFADQEEALKLNQISNQELLAWVNRLTLLLDGARAFLTPQLEEARMDRFYQLLDRLFPWEAAALMRDDHIQIRGGAQWDFDALRILAEPLRAYGKPLLVDDVTKMRWKQPLEGARSMVAVPLGDEEGTHGAVLLFSRQPGAFVRAHQEVLGLLACQLLASIRGAELAREVESSRASLLSTRNETALGQLAGGIAHQLNSPLAAVVLQTSMAIRSKADPEAVLKRLTVAKEAAERARHIIAKLLYYTEESVHEWRRLDVAEIVRDVAELTLHEWDTTGVELKLNLGDTPLLTDGCPHDIQQTLVNLLDNARRAAISGSSPKGVEINGFTGPSGVMLEVIDSGPPIAEETRQRMFEPFFSGWQSTGLGLSSSLAVVQKHKGRLEEIDPLQAKGFRITLPLSA